MHPADEPIRLREIWPSGTLIKGDFVIDRRLGGGGFGTVYLARNRFMGTSCVIKRLHEQFASDPEFVRKFVNEGRAIRRLRGCPHIVEVEHMTQSEDGHLILVMEFVSGGDLGALMESRLLSPDEVIEYARQIAVGLQAAHQAGLVHRDIKPQNVLVGQDSTGRLQLKLIDFGIAADHLGTHQTSIMRGGSIGYAAPEQWVRAGKELDSRTDLYSLGATMYRMLTGHMPYPSVFDIGSWIDEVRKGPPRPVHEVRPDIPLDLSLLIQDLLAVRPEDRPSDAGTVISRLDLLRTPLTPVRSPTVSMKQDLKEVLSEAPPRHLPTRYEGPPPPPLPPPVRPAAAVTHQSVQEPAHVLTYGSEVKDPSRRPWLIGAAAGGVLLLALGAWSFLGQSSNPPVQESTPKREPITKPVETAKASPKPIDRAASSNPPVQPPPTRATPEPEPVKRPEEPKPAPPREVAPPPSAVPSEPIKRVNEKPPLEEKAPKPPERIRVGGNVQMANLIRKVSPVYPALAKQARIQGTVRLSAVIGKDGAIQDLQLVSGHPLLAPNAIAAVKQWIYKPTLLSGEPVEVITQIDVNFMLSEFGTLAEYDAEIAKVENVMNSRAYGQNDPELKAAQERLARLKKEREALLQRAAH